MTARRQSFVLALAIGVAIAGLTEPAGAQLRDFFQFPFGSSQPPAAPTESTRPPAPRKLDPPPSQTVMVIGDSLADWLGFGLEEAFTDTPDIGIVRKIRPLSGLIHYEPRADTPEWSQVVKDMLAPEKPAAIVVMLGINDRIPLRERAEQRPAAAAGAPGTPPGAKTAPATDTTPAESEQPSIAAPEPRRTPGGAFEFHTEQWEELYTKRIDEMIAAVKTKGVPVFWVGLPALRGPRATTDVSYLDELYRARAEKAGIVYVDIWDGFVDDQGRYAVQGPDFEGQIRRLRTYDGVNFTKAGAEKLAHYVEHELRRVVTTHVAPEAVPGPEEQNLSNAPVGERPAVGPVVPLASIGGSGGDLLGGSRPTPAATDPVAVRVLSRGEPLTPPSGRADDFSWPRADANATGAASEPGPPAPPRGATGKAGAVGAEPNKPEPVRPDAIRPEIKKPAAGRTPPAPTAGAAPNTPSSTPPARRPRPELDGAPPRPPAPVGPAAANIH